MKALSIILQIAALFWLSFAVFVMTFISPISRRGIEGAFNRFLNALKINDPERREKLVWILAFAGLVTGVVGLVLQFFV